MVREMKGTYKVFIMLHTRPGLDEKVSEQLLKLKEITEVHLISGLYDLLAVAEVSLHGKAIFTTIQEIAQLLIQKIRKIDGIRDTNTLLPFRSFTKHIS